MSELITHTARLVPYLKRPKQVPSFVTAYSYEPLADEPGAELGSLYVVMEVLVSGRASEEVADLIIEAAGDQYYNQPHDGAEALERFEAAIKAVNHELGEHVNHGNAAWIGKLSAIIAVQVGAELHVAQTGSAEAFLYRGKAGTKVSTASPSRPTTPSKTFGSIATGQLEPGDRLLLATPALVHQVPLERLKSIVSQSSPNTAISEITELLRGASIDRIAGLVIEVTTPELAALQVRSEDPSEIQLGTPENALEAAKMAATPLAQTTVASGKRVADAAQTSWKRAKPHAKAASLALADRIRQLLSTKTGRRRVLIILGVVVLILAALIWRHHATATAAKTFNRYQTAYGNFTRGQQLLDQNQKPAALSAFETTQHQLSALKSYQRSIDQQLSNSPLPQGEPQTMAALSALLATRVSEINGLVKANVTTIASLPAKNARPEHFEITGSKAYVFDAASNNALSIIDVTNGSVQASSADTANLGVVVNTTLAADSSGIYILTNKPSVWFYSFASDTSREQHVAYGQWPAATAIASYLSNIYLLGGGTVYKSGQSSSNFSPATSYLTTAETKDATSLAIDGSIYVISPSGLHQYIAGALKQSAAIPSSLGHVQNIRSTDSGAVIIGTSPGSKQVGLWTTAGAKLTFDKQIAPANVKSLSDAIYDPKSGNIYALADHRLISFPAEP